MLLFLAGSLLMLAGCKKDFSTAGFNAIKDENFQFKQYKASLVTYSEPVERVLAQNPGLINLGVYPHPAFGLSTADVLIQFNNSSRFGDINFINADSILFVELRIPYFSTYNEELSTDTEPIYDLDSVYGDHPVDISVYESNYYLFPYDPAAGLTRPQYFYSDFDFLSHTDNLLAHDDSFYSAPEYLIDTLNVVGGDFNIDNDVKPGVNNDTLPPHFVMPLDTAFFRQKFFEKAGRPVLTDNELFKNYFRGLYVHVKPVNQNGHLMLLDPANARLVIAYRYEFLNNNGTPDDSSDDFIDYGYEEFKLTPATIIQTYRNAFYPQVEQKITGGDAVNGEEKTYVKGDAGAMTVVKLFTPDELYELRNNDWLINQANIRFYIDPTEMNGIPEEEYPAQLFLYKKDSKSTLSDLSLESDDGYMIDLTKVLKIYNGRLTHDEDADIYYYEFNITRHIKEVLRKDSANVALGLRVSIPLDQFLQNPAPEKDPDAYLPYGVVLQGNLSADKPAELIIYYTEPEEE